ncbi:MAG: hypothetical protein J5569_04230 [Oscillospiraceae bacterium]|nr:hypothetical protein [Oscillospiraceae bacterium]
MSERRFNTFGSTALCGALLAIIGYLRLDGYPTLGITLIVLGLVLFVVSFAVVLFTKPYVCPNCGSKEHRILQTARTRNGSYRCPVCGFISHPKYKQ